jgi:hypothetical protein
MVSVEKAFEVYAPSAAFRLAFKTLEANPNPNPNPNPDPGPNPGPNPNLNLTLTATAVGAISLARDRAARLQVSHATPQRSMVRACSRPRVRVPHPWRRLAAPGVAAPAGLSPPGEIRGRGYGREEAAPWLLCMPPATASRVHQS